MNTNSENWMTQGFADACKARDEAIEKCDALRAENERLREALKHARDADSMTTEPKRKAGRPTLYGAKLKARTVKLDDATVEKAKAIGGDNLSEGIRRAVAKAKLPA